MLTVMRTLLLALLVLFNACTDRGSPAMSDAKFCQYLEDENKEQVKYETNQFLETLAATDESSINFEKITAWLEAKSCIKEVKINDKIILTDPPVIEFEIVMAKPELGKLGMKISFDDKYQFYDLERAG
jgi:hypothetical protein